MADRWQRVQALFDAAAEREPGERAGFLDEACGGDGELRREVEALLHADAEAGSFIESAVRRGSVLLAEERDPIEVRGKIGKYEILGRIGEGGFGVVYKGRDPVLQRYVAVKTCSSSDEKLRRRFFREGQIAAGLQHPNITTVHDLGVELDLPYLVQEFLPGEDLHLKIARREPLSALRRLDILLQVARGLEYAHQQGVLHRDIKPSNIRILPAGEVKIMDFGIAKLLHEVTDLTTQGVTMGTVGYLAPEQLRGEPVDRRTDIFAFGILTYEVLTYERPFRGASFSEISYRLLNEEPRALRELAPEHSPEVAALAAGCLAKEPAERYAGMGEVIAELEPAVKLLRSGTRLPRPPAAMTALAPALDPQASLASISSSAGPARAASNAAVAVNRATGKGPSSFPTAPITSGAPEASGSSRAAGAGAAQPLELGSGGGAAALGLEGAAASQSAPQGAGSLPRPAGWRRRGVLAVCGAAVVVVALIALVVREFGSRPAGRGRIPAGTFTIAGPAAQPPLSGSFEPQLRRMVRQQAAAAAATGPSAVPQPRRTRSMGELLAEKRRGRLPPGGGRGVADEAGGPKRSSPSEAAATSSNGQRLAVPAADKPLAPPAASLGGPPASVVQAGAGGVGGPGGPAVGAAAGATLRPASGEEPAPDPRRLAPSSPSATAASPTAGGAAPPAAASPASGAAGGTGVRSAASTPAGRDAAQEGGGDSEAEGSMVRGKMIPAGAGTPPQLLSRPEPDYPEKARRRRQEARVVVAVLVDETGHVIRALVKPAGVPLGLGFAEAAEKAARQAVFRPPTRDGIAGKMWTELPYHFTLH
ncbi:MAG TPA: TonB family protein [Thermoanaerobaculia bacterium]|nr:TonB family protein [Thermoanaerobaculia bacterium]